MGISSTIQDVTLLQKAFFALGLLSLYVGVAAGVPK